MRGADSDEDARFADFKTTETMNDGNAVDGKFSVHFGSDLAEAAESHRLVGFVLEIEGTAAVRVITYAAVEGDDGTVAGTPNEFDKSAGINARTDQFAFGGLK
jgi:hypothetical protein